MTEVLERHNLYQAEFDRLIQERSAIDPPWLSTLRQTAMARFVAQGFPTTRQEEWRFTSVAPITSQAFEPASDVVTPLTETELAPYLLATTRSQLVFAGGRYDPALSSATNGSDVRVLSLAEALATIPDAIEPHLTSFTRFDTHVFAALNTAFIDDGAVILVPANTVVEAPLHMLFHAASSSTPTVSHPRVLIVAGENSQVRIVESYVGRDGQVVFTNGVTQVAVGAGAIVDHYKLQLEGVDACHIALMDIGLDRASTFTSHSIGFGGALVRNDVTAVLGGEGGECTLNGLYLADGDRLVDNHTTIDHATPHCASHEVYKGILGGTARGVFNGKIIVREDAQKTDAKQTNKALLLSDAAQINTKPQLEIFADDVKCTHGATVGQLDEEALFYLRARGIGAADAKNLLIHAFAGDILDRVKIDGLKERLDGRLLERLARVLPHEA